MKILKVKNEMEAGKLGSEIILDLVINKDKPVLGLATGSTPISTYNQIIERTKNEKIDWSNVITFNLDEYKGLKSTDEQSYDYFMRKQLFDHINIKKENTNIPSGAIQTNEEANQYDELIASKGGIDLQLLGLGVNGHVGFNEPPCDFDSLTSIVNLVESTIESNKRFFAKKEDVPTQAISMGMKSIMSAKKILLIALGESKAEAIAELVNGKVDPSWPCTLLQNHKDVTIIIDEKAASKL
ncbi:glucosamine-6-phosphate deaminase [Spiroplasma sp. TIUS-1]|uniref:glucosamine-6-phosphate deaminase n=1 Tax=Spiroplasma sp. TIUS-1 TaxID=216963 RepID=UPI001398D590|nr:glucosamine-6-phosphate deaminase [Spiroplasma sp. TIUS-1]QHX35690.1 glucosamine-6-phosphate deaminase [Spiroplasma sp. TIUS-1]